MTHSIFKHQRIRYSKIAGFLYLIIAVVGGFSIAYVPSEIIVNDNPAATFTQLSNQHALFQLGIAGDLIVLLLEVILTVIIYRLFKHYSPIHMTIATYARLAMTIIMGVNLLNYMIPAIIIQLPEFFDSFTRFQMESLTLLFFKVHRYGELTWQVFFGLHFFTLGFATRKAKLFTKWLAILLILGGVGYAGDSVTQLLFIQSNFVSLFFSGLLFFAVIGELWFAFWLLIKASKTLELTVSV